MTAALVAELSSPAGCDASSGVRLARSRRRLLAVLGAALIAAALAGLVAAGRLAGEHGSRVAVRARVPLAAWGPMSSALGRDDPAYVASPAAGGFVARNPRQKLGAEFLAGGVTVRSGAVVVGMRLQRYGYGSALGTVAAVAPAAAGNRVLYRRGPVSEWYTNGPLGLEQGFTLTGRPAVHGAGPLTLALTLSGNARALLSNARGTVTFSVSGSSLSYRGLLATDAAGRALPAWLELHGHELLLRVNNAGARYPIKIDPFVQQAKLTAADGAANDLLGVTAAIDGNTIAVGAPTIFTGPGAVYVFVKPPTGWANARETAKLTASDGAPGDQIGTSYGLGSTGVAISGNTIVAGAPNATVSGNASEGAVYVFVKPPGGWRSETQAAKLTASNAMAGWSLGTAVGISGKTVVAGAAGFSPGAAYVFVSPPGGWRDETETGELIQPDPANSGGFGIAAAIQGNTIVVGGDSNNNGQAEVVVFLKPAGGWRTETDAAKLTASNVPAGDSPGLGTSVAIDGNTIIGGTEDFNYPGSVYVFTKPPGGWRSETQAAKLSASNGFPGDLFGTWASISGKTIVAGSGFGTLGAAYVFVKPASGWQNDTETAQLTVGAGASDCLGWSTAIDTNTIVVGAPCTTVNGNGGQGAAYVFGDPPAGSGTAVMSGFKHSRAGRTNSPAPSGALHTHRAQLPGSGEAAAAGAVTRGLDLQRMTRRAHR
jgi:FG-GAP repeat